MKLEIEIVNRGPNSHPVLLELNKEVHLRSVSIQGHWIEIQIERQKYFTMRAMSQSY